MVDGFFRVWDENDREMHFGSFICIYCTEAIMGQYHFVTMEIQFNKNRKVVGNNIDNNVKFFPVVSPSTMFFPILSVPLVTLGITGL